MPRAEFLIQDKNNRKLEHVINMKSFFTYKVLFLLFAGWFMVGCGNRELLQAERLLETDVKAADSILSSMPMPTSRRDRAWYAVLKTQVDYKQYKPITSDSLILSATRYYGAHRKNYRSAMAWYSQGCVYSELNNDLAAIDAYLKAKDLFPDTLVRYYALAEQNLGKHYLGRLMLPEATQQFESYLTNGIRLNEINAKKNAIYNLGCCALYSKDFCKADSIFNLILKDPTSSVDQKQLSLFQLSKIRLYHEKDLQKAMELINEYLSYLNSYKNSGAALSVKADIFHEMGQFDSAYIYYSRSLECSNDINTFCSGYDMLTMMSIQLGDKTEAIKYYNSYKSMADSIYERRNHEQINVIESEHRTELAENQLHNRTIRFTIICFSFILISTLLAIIAIICYRNWKKERIWRIRESISQTESDLLNKKLTQSEQDFTETNNPDDTQKRTEILELYCKELKECSKLFQLQDVYSLMMGKTSIYDVEFTREEKVQIITTINDCFRPVIQFLFDEIPGINRDEIYVCILSFLGYNSVQMSRFLDVTDGCIRQRRKRTQDKDINHLTQLFFT